MTSNETMQQVYSWLGAICMGTFGGLAWATLQHMGFAFLMGLAGAIGGLVVKLTWNYAKKKLKAKGWYNG